jgi:hydrogenase maturation protease
MAEPGSAGVPPANKLADPESASDPPANKLAEPGSAGVPPANKILVLGVGNPFRRDDGIGPAVISRLKSENHLNGVDLLDGGTDGLSLIDYIEGYEKVLVVDAVDMGAAPGEVRMFSPEDAKLTIKADTLSTHGFGLAEVIALMEKLEMKTDMHIIGIQAKDVNFGEGMSPELSSKIEEILKLIKENI